MGKTPQWITDAATSVAKSLASDAEKALVGNVSAGSTASATAAGVTTPPAAGAQRSDVASSSSVFSSILAPLEGSLNDALQKSEDGLVAKAQSALQQEETKIKYSVVYTLGGAALGGLLYTAQPLIGAAAGGALALFISMQ
jgi:hypothetical protein